MKPPNCIAKEFFVIKENCPVQNATKTIKSTLEAKNQYINLKTIVLSSSDLKYKHKNSSLKLLQK